MTTPLPALRRASTHAPHPTIGWEAVGPLVDTPTRSGGGTTDRPSTLEPPAAPVHATVEGNIMPTWLIWVIVIVVVVVIVARDRRDGRKRRTEQRRIRAEELRQEASAQASGLTESQRSGRGAARQGRPGPGRGRAGRGAGGDAEQGHQVEQAGYEDKLREADRLDPEVDHKSADYEPDVWNDRAWSDGTPRRPTPARPATTDRHAAGGRLDADVRAPPKRASTTEPTSDELDRSSPGDAARASTDDARRRPR